MSVPCSLPKTDNCISAIRTDWEFLHKARIQYSISTQLVTGYAATSSLVSQRMKKGISGWVQIREFPAIAGIRTCSIIIISQAATVQ